MAKRTVSQKPRNKKPAKAAPIAEQAAAQQAADIVAGVLAGKPNELPMGSQARQIATGMFHHLKRALETPKPVDGKDRESLQQKIDEFSLEAHARKLSKRPAVGTPLGQAWEAREYLKELPVAFWQLMIAFNGHDSEGTLRRMSEIAGLCDAASSCLDTAFGPEAR